MSETRSFVVKNCSLASIATGDKANSLIELRDKLFSVEEGCIYFHFWGGRMKPQHVHSQYHNDFASWVFHRLHDATLAEKLSIIDPTNFDSLEDLRHDLIETIEQRLDEEEFVRWTKREDAFYFVQSLIVVFDSTIVIPHPDELVNILPQLPPSSIFYHFIEARRRTSDKTDDFSTWLALYGDTYKELIDAFQSIDPYFLSLTQLREELHNKVK